MKRIFRRNQIIITTLAVMIAAAGYLNYSSKKEVAGAEVYEAGMMDISDSDILAENQAKSGVDDGSLTEIASLDGDGEEKLPDGNEVAAVPESAEVSEKENAAETLLKAKGFVDPVVSITDGKADVVVNAASLTDQERAQIEDIVKRKTEIGADGIVITLLDAEE